MYYYLIRPSVTYNLILIAVAVIPAAVLMFRIYRADRLEKESPVLLRRLVVAGILSSLIALVSERALMFLLGLVVAENTALYNVLLYFVVVAFSEEGAKYLLLRRYTWRTPEFNCRYDGVVYSVFVSLGFALWENISYVLFLGLHTAFARAVTAIPGHASFGVFMGVFYALAKEYEKRGKSKASKVGRVLAVFVPALLHGAYDFIVTLESNGSTWIFAAFAAVLFIVSFSLDVRSAKKDRYIDNGTEIQ